MKEPSASRAGARLAPQVLGPVSTEGGILRSVLGQVRARTGDTGTNSEFSPYAPNGSTDPERLLEELWPSCAERKYRPD